MTYAKDGADVEQLLAKKDQQIAALTSRVDDLERNQRDTDRYAKIHAIGEAHEIGDEKEHLAEIINASDAEFDRYSKLLTRMPKKGDVTSLDLPVDDSLDVERMDYSRAQERRGNGKKLPSQDEIERYSRMASDSCVKKRQRGEETTPDAELKTILTAKGFGDVLTEIMPE